MSCFNSTTSQWAAPAASRRSDTRPNKNRPVSCRAAAELQMFYFEHPPMTAGQFSVKLLFKNFPVVILCIGIILVFQNIIHGGWWWYCRRGGGTDGIWCKRISVPNFPVVILCIGIILVFQNIIHGGWWWCCRRGGDTNGIWYKRISVPNFIT